MLSQPPRRPTVPSTTKVVPTVSAINRPVVAPPQQKPVVLPAQAAQLTQPIQAPRIAPRTAPAPQATTEMIEQTSDQPLAIQTGGQLALPDYMQSYLGEGTEELAQYVLPPRLKIIQPLSVELKQTLGVGDGDILVTPMNLRLLQMPRDGGGNPMYDDAKPIVVTPIFFWKEWCQWNDVNLRNTPGERPVLVKTLDPMHEVARKACNKATYTEAHPRFADHIIKNVEHLCFLVYLHGVEEVDGPVILSFQRGDHVAGRQACQLIKLRRAPIWGNVLGVKAVQRSWQNNQWPGMDLVTLPAEIAAPFIPADSVEFFRGKHEEYKQMHAEKALTGIDEGAEIDDAPTVATIEGM